MKLRRHPDGSFWLPKANPKIEGELDLQMNRVPGSLKWFPKYNSLPFEDIYKLLEGKEVNIVGKGPSLDRLTSSDLGGRPTFAINEAIHRVEKYNDPEITFGIVQDGNLKSSCTPTMGAGLICNARVMGWYATAPRLWVFSPGDFDLGVTAITALIAVRLAARGRATKLRMLAFDAALNKDLRYAASIGHQPNLYGPPTRFLGHRSDIEASSTLQLDWVTIA